MVSNNSVDRKRAVSEQTADDEYLVSLADFLQILGKRWLTILLITLGITGVGLGWSLMQQPRYEASIKILVGQTGEVDPGSLGSNVAGLEQFTTTLAYIVDSQPIAETVIRRLDLQVSQETFLENLTAARITDTQVIEVTYEDSSASRAQRVANTVGEVFSARITELSPDASGVTASLWERAALPEASVSPNYALNTALALLVGVTLGVGAAFVLESLENGRSSTYQRAEPSRLVAKKHRPQRERASS